MSHDPSELPWNEEQWLRFMQQADARSARFGELLETLADDPNQHEIIAREMGWDHLLADGDAGGGDETAGDDGTTADEAAGEEDETPFDPQACIEEAIAEIEAEKLEHGDDTNDEADYDWPAEERQQRRSLPAYARAFDWGLAVHRALQPWMQAEFTDDHEPEPDDPLMVAYGESLVVSAKLVAGHGMGYDDNSICGNIVCCRKSLAAADQSLAALAELQASGLVDARTLSPLVAEGQEVRRLVEQRIAELRARVWWQ